MVSGNKRKPLRKTSSHTRFTATGVRRGTAAAATAIVVLALAGTSARSLANREFANEEETARIEEATIVLEEIAEAPDRVIPRAIFNRSVGIAIIPSTVRAGFFVGGQRGRGVIVAKDTETGEWSMPAFLILTGGSIGLQVGAQSVDVILLIQNRRGLSRLLDNEFKLGGDVSAVVGPVGRSLEASTDLQLTAEILSYSRARGVFAGATIGGATLRADRDANERFYGERLESPQIVLDGGGVNAAAPDVVTRLWQALDGLASDDEDEPR